ncbi:hypothetical protein MAR_033907, partial [Mya arenaria]
MEAIASHLVKPSRTDLPYSMIQVGRRDYKRNNFKVFVLTLAVIDLVICGTLIPAEMVKQRKYFEFGDVVTCKVKCFFNVFG